MSIHIYRYGESQKLPGLSIGVTRQAPRGVRKEERASRGYFEVWLPMLGPSRELLGSFRKKEISFTTFARRYRTEMKRPEARQVISLLAALAQKQRINLGCFCENPDQCHRSLLRDLVAAELPEKSAADATGENPGFASPPCYLPEFFDEE